VEKRIVLFLLLSIGILFANYYVQTLLRKDDPAAQQANNLDPAKDKPADRKKAADKGKDAAKDNAKNPPGDNAAKSGDPADTANASAANSADANDGDANAKAIADGKLQEVKVAEQYFTLGSRDPASGYRMLVTLTNRGAAVERVELNGDRLLALEDRSGYLGHLAPVDAKTGALVRAVGAGTPAAEAGLRAAKPGSGDEPDQPGDIITKINEVQVTSAQSLIDILAATKPNDTIEITVLRGDATQTLLATLGRVPAQVIRPEKDTQPIDLVEPGNHDPLSMLLTLQQIDERKLTGDNPELAGVNLRNANWEAKQLDDRTVEFSRTLPREKLRVVKRYKISRNDVAGENPEGNVTDGSPTNWHLVVDVEVRNLDSKAHDIAYQLDGPNGLPIEGWWYSYRNRISRKWFNTLGVRDVAMRFEGSDSSRSESVLISSLDMANDKVAQTLRVEDEQVRLVYAGLDSQYFAAALLPVRQTEGMTPWLSDVKPVIVGDIPKVEAYKKLINVTCRLISKRVTLPADDAQPLKHTYQLFVGPKQREVLASYGTDDSTLADLVYFGWPIWGFVANIMLSILHFFYGFVGNYGICIIMLTVLVRLCMFPLSRKQALSAQKMQELQPEMKRLKEKHKGNNEASAKAMQELWRKNNYNPLGGCLPAFIQLPIFIGLYRSLMIDFELRGAPLFGEAVRWVSNLGAPDMLFRWDSFLPAFIASPTGWLGPYFNLLPLFTVVLFWLQQKMFMPPPTDEQSALQQKMMQYMMIFMAFMFYTVASGLCLYFIVSSLWGIGERKLLPKLVHAKPTPATETAVRPVATATSPPTSNGNGSTAAQRRKNRGRK